jgi:hypothetical protein
MASLFRANQAPEGRDAACDGDTLQAFSFVVEDRQKIYIFLSVYDF